MCRRALTVSALSLAACSSCSFTSSCLLRAATDSEASFSFFNPVFILGLEIQGSNVNVCGSRPQSPSAGLLMRTAMAVLEG